MKLTERQLEVLVVYLKAGTINATAEWLGVGESTVKQTLAACRAKLKANRNRDLLQAAQEANVIRFEVKT